MDCQLNTVEVADFLAGFVYGFTGNNWQSYFETCFKDTPAFETDVCTAVNDFATKENQKVIQGIQLLIGDFPELNQFLAACPNAAADIATTESWAKYWSNQGTMKLYSTAYKNILKNESTVLADVHTLTADYDA